MASTDEQALIALLVAAFLLKGDEITQMAALILSARLASTKASYQRACDTTGVESGDWEPPDDLLQRLQDRSRIEAEGIAHTYEEDLSGRVTAFVDAWQEAHETLDGCEEAARTELADWGTKRAAWKSEQIAGYTCGSGADSGTDAWLDDLDDGEFSELNPDDLEVTVLPEESSNDVCREYAGQSFNVDEIDTIPEFPVHASCIHRKVIQMKG